MRRLRALAIMNRTLTARDPDKPRPSPLERPCKLRAEFSMLRVAPVRSAGSPVAGLDWRQKIKHRCDETKTFYVSTRSQKCLVRRRGAWRPCRALPPVRVDRLSPACAKRYRAFWAGCKVRTRWISEELRLRRRVFRFRTQATLRRGHARVAVQVNPSEPRQGQERQRPNGGAGSMSVADRGRGKRRES
jgi:hypothetical protein